MIIRPYNRCYTPLRTGPKGGKLDLFLDPVLDHFSPRIPAFDAQKHVQKRVQKHEKEAHF